MLFTCPFKLVMFSPMGCGLRVVVVFVVPLSLIALACCEFMIPRAFEPVEIWLSALKADSWEWTLAAVLFMEISDPMLNGLTSLFTFDLARLSLGSKSTCLTPGSLYTLYFVFLKWKVVRGFCDCWAFCGLLIGASIVFYGKLAFRALIGFKLLFFLLWVP